MTHLALYNLIMNGCDGRRGFYHWNEDICGFIRSNWNALMPHRKKTQSWHSTVAGTLSLLPSSLVRCGIFCFQCMTPYSFSCLCVIWQLVEYVGISYYVNDSLRMEVFDVDVIVALNINLRFINPIRAPSAPPNVYDICDRKLWLSVGGAFSQLLAQSGYKRKLPWARNLISQCC